ncbi:DUF262 domain-containing protein [Undibacterium pigrum]|uniref:Uncharacterized protein DUF262 n=1 Tax=Undibacterium pigrum TaxID=401470 RepID=A0A318JJ39_9BURK|nr:DUF262 domain-containing protein [Undibacterium pigrum]PXX47172.1 uncharacterized protein DUF262 [Undibacterium pigrum]
MHDLDKRVISVRQLLTQPALSIPAYQRPYKWSQENLNALLVDLRVYRGKSAYRLGTVVFHQHCDEGDEQLDIVDGQQRTLTLLLLVKALIKERLPLLKREDLKKQLHELSAVITPFLTRQHFSSDISHRNLHQNFMAALRATSRPEFTEEDIDFLLNKCELVTFVLTDVSEAFQFFDSQNARGRDLDPHDLLKAFHLREFSQEESHLKAHSVSHWEGLDSKTLAQLFANYLFRIRNWAQGKSAQYFSKAHVDLFKGINLEQIGLYPYVESLRIAHHFVDDYNSQYHRRIDHQSMRFPFHLDQMVINGRRFFEMATHYQQTIADIVDDEHHEKNNKALRLLNTDLDAVARRILHTLNTYGSRTRAGDKYIRTLFDNALIFYIDKFGTQELSQAIEKLFVWAYTCRLQMQAVQIATMDNHALDNNVFELIKQSVKPSDVLNWPLGTIKKADIKGTKVDEIITLFKELKYHE